LLSCELKDKVLQYVEREITVEELEDWLVPRLPLYATREDTPDSDLSAAVELGLAEMNDGIRTEDEFRCFVATAVRQAETAPGACFFSNDTSFTESANQTMQIEHMFPSLTTLVLSAQVQ
jgi:hypothetical protein